MNGSARPMNPERGADRATGKGGRPGVGPSDSPPTSSAVASARGLVDRPWLQRRIRFENRLARRLKKLARVLDADTHRLTKQAVVDFHKAKGTWPQPDHIYPEMRGDT